MANVWMYGTINSGSHIHRRPSELFGATLSLPKGLTRTRQGLHSESLHYSSVILTRTLTRTVALPFRRKKLHPSIYMGVARGLHMLICRGSCKRHSSNCITTRRTWPSQPDASNAGRIWRTTRREFIEHISGTSCSGQGLPHVHGMQRPCPQRADVPATLPPLLYLARENRHHR